MSETGDAIGVALAEGYRVRLQHFGVITASGYEGTKVVRLKGPVRGTSQTIETTAFNVRVRAFRKLKNRLKLADELEKSETRGK